MYNLVDNADKEGDSTLTKAIKRFAGDKKSPSLEIIKGTLLATADQMVATISELVIENAQYDKGINIEKHHFINVSNCDIYKKALSVL